MALGSVRMLYLHYVKLLPMQSQLWLWVRKTFMLRLQLNF